MARLTGFAGTHLSPLEYFVIVLSLPKNQFLRFFVEEDRCYRSGVRTYRLNRFSLRPVLRGHRPDLRTHRTNRYATISYHRSNEY